MNKNKLLNRTFVRRTGKSLSPTKKKLISDSLSQITFNVDNIKKAIDYDQVILEIGFGMGGHFLEQIRNNPNNLYIGSEVYLNGIANVLKHIDQEKLDNLLIWPDDADLLLEKLPNHFLNGIYILFPDPWPKRRQHNRRLLNHIRLNVFKDKLKKSGFLIFASDIMDYFEKTQKLVLDDHDFKVIEQDLNTPHPGYITTKYHQKAICANRIAKFLQIRKN